MFRKQLTSASCWYGAKCQSQVTSQWACPDDLPSWHKYGQNALNELDVSLRATWKNRWAHELIGKVLVGVRPRVVFSSTSEGPRSFCNCSCRPLLASSGSFYGLWFSGLQFQKTQKKSSWMHFRRTRVTLFLYVAEIFPVVQMNSKPCAAGNHEKPVFLWRWCFWKSMIPITMIMRW